MRLTTVTGSLGNISKPLALQLIKNGHTVTVISSSPEKQSEIESLGAIAAIGSVDDVEFLTKAFSGADAVYGMIPPSFSEPDFIGYNSRIAGNYAKAIIKELSTISIPIFCRILRWPIK